MHWLVVYGFSIFFGAVMVIVLPTAAAMMFSESTKAPAERALNTWRLTTLVGVTCLALYTALFVVRYELPLVNANIMWGFCAIGIIMISAQSILHYKRDIARRIISTDN